MAIMDTCLSGDDRALVEGELDKILNSRQFASAPTVRAFLAFVVHEVLAGRGDRIKAYTIATEAFGRNAEFDPSSDTIVRTTAGRVRKALDAYYRERDADVRVIISLPKGAYAPAFEFRDAPSPPPPVPPGWSPRIRRTCLRPGIITAICLVAVVAAGLATFAGWEPEQSFSPSNVIIDVLPVDGAGPQAQRLARAIDLRLAPALSRIGMAEIFPPGISSSPSDRPPATGDAAAHRISFTLGTSIEGSEHPRWFWRLIDTESGHLLWASRESFPGTDSASIDRAVSRVAFQVLGTGGAIPSALERYRGEIFSKPTCLSRAQLMRVIGNDAAYPKVRNCLERIVTLFPNDASAWAVLSNFYSLRSYIYWAGDREEREKLVAHAERAAERAAELAPEAYLTKVALMHLSLRQGHFAEFDVLQQEIRKRYPGDVYLQIRIATRLARLGRGREALEIFDKAREDAGINLKNWAPGIAVAYFSEGEYEHAHRHILRASSDMRRFVLVLKAAILGKLNRVEEAAAIVDKLVAANPDIRKTLCPWLLDIGWEERLVRDIADGLARAGLKVAHSDSERPALHALDQ